MTVINSVQVRENVVFTGALPRLTPCDRFDADLTFHKLGGTVFRWLKLYQEASFIYYFKVNGDCRDASRDIWKKARN